MAPRLLATLETQALCARFGLELAPARLISGAEAALASAEELGYPLALKAVSPAQTHKTDAGLVILDLKDPDQLQSAWDELARRSHGLPLEGMLVQKMAAPGLEVLVGVQVDPQFGPVVALGLGGALVHLLDELALALPPLTRLEVEDLLAETRLGRLLTGVRGGLPADRAALIDLVLKVSRLAVDGPPLAALDFNPVIVHPAGQGLSLVDARIFAAEGS